MKSIVTRWIALVLALVMCVGVLPIGALAEGEEEPEVTDPAEPVADSDGGEEPDEPAEPDDVGEPQDPYEVYDQTTDTDAPEDGDAEPEVMQDGEYAPSAESEEPQAAAANEPADTDANEGEGEDGEEEDTRVVTDEGLRIERLAARVAFGAVENEKGDWVWTPLNDWNGHDFAYRVTYSFGSTEMFMPEEIEFFIPKSIIRNIRGEKSDLYEMSIPHKDAEGLTNTNVYVYEEVGDKLRYRREDLRVYGLRRGSAGRLRSVYGYNEFKTAGSGEVKRSGGAEGIHRYDGVYFSHYQNTAQYNALY